MGRTQVRVGAGRVLSKKNAAQGRALMVGGLHGGLGLTFDERSKAVAGGGDGTLVDKNVRAEVVTLDEAPPLAIAPRHHLATQPRRHRRCARLILIEGIIGNLCTFCSLFTREYVRLPGRRFFSPLERQRCGGRGGSGGC